MWVLYNVKDGNELQCDECGEWIMPVGDPVSVWLLINEDEGLVVQRLLCDPCSQLESGEGAMLLPFCPQSTTDGVGWREPVLTAAGRAKLAEIQGG